MDKRRVAALVEPLHDLDDDDDFWAHQARSLAVLATPTSFQTFRLANRLSSMVEVSDRFYLKPLLRAVILPQTGFVLALSGNSVRLVEFFADLPPEELRQTCRRMPRATRPATRTVLVMDVRSDPRMVGAVDLIIGSAARRLQPRAPQRPRTAAG